MRRKKKMNRVQPENVHSTIFTPQEYQVELIDSCMQGNTVAVLASKSTRTFLVTMVTRELSYQTRSPEEGGLNQCTLIIGKSGPKLVKAGEAIQQNTNLAVATYTSLEQVNGWHDERWQKVLLDSQVIVMTYDVLEEGFETGFLNFEVLNLFVITDAHQMLSSEMLKEILSVLSPCCRILAMTAPVLSLSPSPSILDSLLAYLKRTTGCIINTSSEIVTILRYVNKPHERLIICASPFSVMRPSPEEEVRRLTSHAMTFLEDHRYDLVEVYGPEYAEFCVGVPDPLKEPKQILKDFVNVLDTLGLWCADRAALYSLVEIEKLKKKTAYDRHYLLLCLIFSLMARVRAVIESAFESHSELHQILNFSTPKVLRLVEILRQIRPLNFVDPRKRRDKGDAPTVTGSEKPSEERKVQEEEGKNEEAKLTFFSTNDKALKGSWKQLCCCSCHCKGSSNNSSSSISSYNSGTSKATPDTASMYVDRDKSLCDDADFPIVSLSSNSAVKASSTSADDEGCEMRAVDLEASTIRRNGDVTENIESTSTKNKESDVVIVDGGRKKNAYLSNGSTDCDSRFPSPEKDPASSTTPLMSCDPVPLSTSYMNGNLSSSQDSLHDSFRSCSPSSTIPDGLDLMSSSPHSLQTSLDDDSRQFTSAMAVSANSSVNMISPTLSGSGEKGFSLPQNSETCICHCHQRNFSSSPTLQPSITIPNGCLHSTEDESLLVDDTFELFEKLPSTPMRSNLVTTKSMESLSLELELNSDNRLYGSAPDVSVTISCLEHAHNNASNKADGGNESVELTADIHAKGENAIEVLPITSFESKLPLTSEAIAMADTLAQLLPTVTKPRKKRDEVKEKVKVHNPEDPDSVCGLIFVRHRTTAKIIYRLLKELSDIGGEFSWIFPQYTVELCKNATEDPRAAEAEHKKQEEVLRRFRHHECNLLVSTAVLEEGIDIPNCNLVIRFDPAASYSSYVYSRGRAKGAESFYFHLVVKEEEEKVFSEMASYAAYEKVLLSHCGSVDEGTDSEVTAEEAIMHAPPYVTSTGTSVSMATSITLLNKYCAKLPSDTFTRLTAMWMMESKTNSDEGEEELFQCTLMLPINSPLKGFTKGAWMKKKSLAKMSAALVCCTRLHEIGELNDNLLPVGKESMQLDAHLCAPLPDDEVSEGMPRPGSTKRRQYYYKKVAECLVGEEPSPTQDLWVYKLDMVLTCPIPDEQNTRGRKIYRPESSPRSLGLVTTKPIPQVSGFPVFTRSGEVMVKVREVQDRIRIKVEDLEGLKSFHMFTFTHVLRLEKYPIKFHPSNAKTTFFIAPLLGDSGPETIDWEFVNLIRAKKDHKPIPPTEEARKKFKFRHTLYQDAVVMPWYRNQDQPQYFYVAEICSHLHPQSDFPDTGFESFEKYYLTKYGLQICNLQQPLLDVDHTSGRLNLLTPRHVNRKGVALPTTSEETKKAKRESLQQKQILVPELCTIHPFPASLWRKAVCLPTILYRINGLLLANELRVCVAREIGLGMTLLPSNFEWPNLDFGWTLADVLARSSDTNKEGREEIKGITPESQFDEGGPSGKRTGTKNHVRLSSTGEVSEKTGGGPELEIGTWSNDMALTSPPPSFDGRETEDDFEIDSFDPTIALPDNLTMLEGNIGDDDIEGELGADWGTGLPERKTRVTTSRSKNKDGDGIVRVGSPSNFETDGWDVYNGGPSPMFGPYGTPPPGYYYDYGDDFEGYESEQEEEEEEEEDFDGQEKGGASTSWEDQGKRRGAVDKASLSDEEGEDELDWPQECLACPEKKEQEFVAIIKANMEDLRQNRSRYLAEDEAISIKKACRKKQDNPTHENSSQTDEKVLLTLSTVRPVHLTDTQGGLEGSSVATETESGSDQTTTDEGAKKIKSLKADKATQTDVISFATNSDPEIRYKVDREKTLAEVKAASETLALTVALLEKASEECKKIEEPERKAGQREEEDKRGMEERNNKENKMIKENEMKTEVIGLGNKEIGVKGGESGKEKNNEVSKENINIMVDEERGVRDIEESGLDDKQQNIPEKGEEAEKESSFFTTFSFDEQPDLETHAGPSPSILLQALTMSNANDGVNLERLETIGDSYLKYAITNYLYCTYTQKHEGKLSYLRSKQVSNLNLYRLGKRKGLGECMVATKFEPHDNWLPPGYFVPRELEEALIDSGVPAGHWNLADFPGLHDLGSEEIRRLVHERSEQIKQNKAEQLANELISVSNPQDLPIFIPYNLLTQHSIPDKSISDCVEALIGAYLTTCGPRGALLFMSWLGIKVLANTVTEKPESGPLLTYHQLMPPPSPLTSCPFSDAKEQLDLLLSGYPEFEKKVGYRFRDQSYLLQAFTHASYYRNRLTDCYQRLEFLGDAVLDYLITRHLFEDKRQHSPGSLTDLRSALVNNTIFACLAVKFEFHKYFRHFSPGLDRVVRDFVRMQEENGHKINEEYYFMEEEECEAAEDIEVPKALGDVFESVAGAIFLDSGGSLDAVWKVYYSMMKNEIEQFSGVVPKSPIRELLETEPETAKFGKPERLVDGKVRVSVEIFGKGSFSGVGRNYRIAKSTAAKRALRHLKKLQALACNDNQHSFP